MIQYKTAIGVHKMHREIFHVNVSKNFNLRNVEKKPQTRS
jgi:hypothetical protein